MLWSLSAAGAAQHPERRVLRVIDVEDEVLFPVYHQHRQREPGREVRRIGAGRGLVQEETAVQEDRRSQAALGDRRDDRSRASGSQCPTAPRFEDRFVATL
jgi:hypothetical protein